MLHYSADSILSEFMENRLVSFIEILETAILLIHEIGTVVGFAMSKPPETREQVCDCCSRICFSILTSGFNDEGKQLLIQCWYRSVLKKIVRTSIFVLFV